MRKLIRSLLCAFLFCGTLLLLSGCLRVGGGNSLVRVMLTEGEDYTILSDNPVSVPLGGDAVFSVSLPEGAVCIQTSGGAVYDADAGTLTLSRVCYPQTITMRTAVNPEIVKFFLENAGGGGYVGADIEQGLVYAGSVANVFVRTKPEFRFDGWSLRHSLEKGGALVSTSESFSYTVTQNTFLYANFTRVVEEKKDPEEATTLGKTRLFTYDANGGVYAGTTVSIVPFDIPISHIYENCFPVQDQFVREGYQLIEYNTKADGSGTGYSPGSKIIEPDTGDPVYLYCIWAKESDASLFSWEEADGGVAVTAYRGAEDTVVIPEKLGGKPVVRIRSGAFTDAPFETLVIPRTVRVVESAAFGCTSAFTTLYMFDTIKEIPDDAFTDTSGFSKFRLNAARDPVYTNSTEGCFGEKWERIVSSEKPVIVVVSGSSSLYGLNGAMLQSFVGDEYTVVNYGTNAGTSSVFYLEMLSHYLDEGDIVIHAPEVGSMTMGGTEISWRLFRGTEYYYNAWRDVDMRRYSHLFRSLTEHAEITSPMAPLDYTMRAYNMNEYGDISNTTAYQTDDYHAGANIVLSPGVISGRNQEELNHAYSVLLEKGVRVYMSCAPCNANAIAASSRSEEAQAAYMQSLRESVCVPVISDIGDYILEGCLMYNSDYHPNAWGRDMRTEQLFADLAAQLKQEGVVLGVPQP